jgi:D-alanyl-D-alanine carboxypeptidase
MKIITTGALLLIIVIGLNGVRHKSDATKEASKPIASFDMRQNSVSDNGSPWVIVNKQRPLNPLTYEPADLVVPSIPLEPTVSNTEKQVRQVTATALLKLVSKAKSQGINLNLQSGYRSYYFQDNLYNRYVTEQGQAAADSESARAGYSEHQTGLTADIGSPDARKCNVEQCFANTKQGKWLTNNAYKYGFIIRYPANRQRITGYVYEPWHIRYVGTYLSYEMHAKRITTLESFFKLKPAPNY